LRRFGCFGAGCPDHDEQAVVAQAVGLIVMMLCLLALECGITFYIAMLSEVGCSGFLALSSLDKSGYRHVGFARFPVDGNPVSHMGFSGRCEPGHILVIPFTGH
jgi:hypothetical protein